MCNSLDVENQCMHCGMDVIKLKVQAVDYVHCTKDIQAIKPQTRTFLTTNKYLYKPA